MLQNEQTAALVKRAKKGDREAMSELYKQTCQRTYRTILGLVRDDETARDLTQDTYVAAFSGLQKLEDPERFQPWLISTAVHKSKNHLRRSRPVLFTELEDAAQPEQAPDLSPESSPEVSLERKETARIVNELLGDLSESQRLAVELYYYDQLTTTEIARSLEIPQSTVKTQLHYARKKLEAGLRRLQEAGVELGGLTAAGCFGFMRSMEPEPVLPPRQAEEILSRVLPRLPKHVAAKTGAQLFKGVLGKIALSAAAVAVVGGAVAGGIAMSKNRGRGDLGDVRPVKTTEPTAVVETLEELNGPFSADYEDLWTVLENDYPLLPYLAGLGMDLNAIKLEYGRQAAQASTVEEYMAVLTRLLENRLKMTGGLRLVQPYQYQAYYYGFMSELPDPEAEAERAAAVAPWRAVLTDDGLSEAYSAPDVSGYSETAQSTYAPSVRWYKDEKAIHIHFYVGYDEERDRDLVEKVLARYPEAENLILDLRDCKGGSTEYWNSTVIEPLGGSWEFSLRGYFRGAPEITPFYESLNCADVSELENVPAWVRELGLDKAYVEQVQIDTGKPASELKLWVLTNSRTSSAAVWLPAFAQATGWAVVIGEHTSTSEGLSFQPVLVRLPKSGLLIEFTEAVETPRGDLQSVTGIIPDYECDSNDALDTCLALIAPGGVSRTNQYGAPDNNSSHTD